MSFISYLQLIRAPNGITALSNILASVFVASVVSNSGDIHVSATLLLCVSSVCFYYAGMVLNDCLDLKEDTKERPQRPLPSGAVAVKHAYGIVVLLSVFGLWSAYLNSWQSFFIAVALLINIIVYDGLIKKGMPGAFAMGGCRYVNWLLGLSILPLTTDSWLIPLPIFFYIAALTYLSKQETHARDSSSMMVVAILLCFSMVSMVACVWHFFGFSTLNISVMAVFSALVAYRLWHTFRSFTPRQIQATVTWMIIGIIPLDALMVIFAGHYIVALVLFSLIWPCRFLSRTLYMT